MDSVDVSDYLIVKNYKNNKGKKINEFIEYDGKLTIKYYNGINSKNFIITKEYIGDDNNKNTECEKHKLISLSLISLSLSLSFSISKLYNIYYININGDHLIDYKKFIKIQQISKIETDIPSIKIKGYYFGEIIITNCDTEIFHKALSIINDYMKKNKNIINDIIYFIFHT